MSPVDPSQADRVIAKIEAQYKGAVRFKQGDEKVSIRRIPTGNVELDFAMSGGLPMGRWSHFWGGRSSGKSLTCWQIIREAQKMGMECAYYDIEKQYDPVFVKAQGVDIKKLHIVEGSTIEGVGGTLENLLSVYHVHVLDSLAEAVSVDELNAKVEEWQMGLQARAWGKVLRRCHERMDDNENAVIMVNQARDAFGAGSEHPPGGRLIDFISSMTMWFKRGGWLHRNPDGILDLNAVAENTLSGKMEPEGLEFQVRITKSRVGRPERAAMLRYDLTEGGYDELWNLAKAARHFKITPKTSEKSSYYQLPDGTTVQGEMKLRDAIAKDKDLQKKVKEAVLRAA